MVEKITLSIERIYGKVRGDVREIISTLCKYKGVEIIAGAVCIYHCISQCSNSTKDNPNHD